MQFFQPSRQTRACASSAFYEIHFGHPVQHVIPDLSFGSIQFISFLRRETLTQRILAVRKKLQSLMIFIMVKIIIVVIALVFSTVAMRADVSSTFDTGTEGWLSVTLQDPAHRTPCEITPFPTPFRTRRQSSRSISSYINICR